MQSKLNQLIKLINDGKSNNSRVIDMYYPDVFEDSEIKTYLTENNYKFSWISDSLFGATLGIKIFLNDKEP